MYYFALRIRSHKQWNNWESKKAILLPIHQRIIRCRILLVIYLLNLPASRNLGLISSLETLIIHLCIILH